MSIFKFYLSYFLTYFLNPLLAQNVKIWHYTREIKFYWSMHEYYFIDLGRIAGIVSFVGPFVGLF